MQTAVKMQASVLVVDDEARQSAALCDTLEDTGYKATGFTSARHALAALRESEFDLRLRSENIQLREALALSEVSTTVASVLDPQVVLDKVADAMFHSLGSNGTALFIANHDRRTLDATIVRGEAWSHIRDVSYPIDCCRYTHARWRQTQRHDRIRA